MDTGTEYLVGIAIGLMTDVATEVGEVGFVGEGGLAVEGEVVTLIDEIRSLKIRKGLYCCLLIFPS